MKGGGREKREVEREMKKKNIEECDKWALIIEMREICMHSFMETRSLSALITTTISNNQNEFVLINNNKPVLTSLY